MNCIKAIIQKELHRVFTDKRLIVSVFLLPVILIPGLYYLMGTLQDNMTEKIQEHQSIVVMQGVPNKVKELLKSGSYSTTAKITYLEENEDIEKQKEAIQEGEQDLLVVFDSNFESSYQDFISGKGELPKVTIYYDSTSNYSIVAKENLESLLLEPYNLSQIEEVFGNAEFIHSFSEQAVSVAEEQKENSQMLSMMLPYFICLLLFASAMSLGVDAIAGEKERGTMTALLLAPVSRKTIVMGKVIALSILSMISAIITFLSMIIAAPQMLKNSSSDKTNINFSFDLSVIQIIELFFILISMILLFVAIVFLIASLSKSVKEANTYMTPIYMIVLVIGLMSMYQGNMEKSDWYFMVPVLGNTLAIQNLMLAELSITQFISSVLSSILVFILLIIGIGYIFDSEKMIEG